MLKKVLNLELFSLFFLSTICLVHFVFKDYLPDHSFAISSSSESYFIGSYYFSSFVAELSYYIGPWVIVPSILFLLIYKFVLSQRYKKSDALVAVGITLMFYFLTFMVAPQYLGRGLNLLSQEHVTAYFSFFSFLGLFLLVSYLSLRGAFFILLKRIQIKLETIGLKSLQKIHFVKKLLGQSGHRINLKRVDLNEMKDKLLLTFKRDTIESSEDLPSSAEVSAEVVEEEFVEDELENEEFEANSELDEGLQNPEEKTSSRPIKKKRKVKKSKFFDSKELIDCISQNMSHSNGDGPSSKYFQKITEAIETKLSEFKLDGKIINILKGPVVDTFELELGSGVKVSKVTGLSDDIGLALNGAPIRLVYPMRGKSTIGIEVPRNPRDFILLDEVLKSKAFNDSQHRLPIAMGKDAFGAVKVVDLAGMPHMLVAGATGAGKSVFINTLLVSLIIKKSPQELKLVLIDPKQLELALFANLPHLMLPVLTQPKNSAVALLWAVEEMERRYSILREMGVKNIEGFNRKVATCDQSILFKINEYYEDHHEGYKLPYIVIVIDEFADLILSKMGKEIETNVNRLAAKARAAGIHLVVATQRPSTDVVTGIIKANFPTRVSFRVSTGHDSKTILDQYGAEKLLGKGDMLYKHGVDLLRLHSSFVEEFEIEGVIQKLETIPQTFDENAVEFLENGGEDDVEMDGGSGNYTSGTSDDPMYQQAIEVVMESGSASASMLQRRLRVGYNRAANIVEEMERNGVVGPAQGSKPRKVIKAG
ncbi:MAG: DNA translocase FtsK [Halobacteriovoraceae bacterium]|nr:DNA translocase FtsK [Halobacteriovoraceae bacterium]|tara:strand:+ start:1424 stop:3715 length:2292 start_codon:yes stop_codon:yes gene_type:complete